MKVFDFSVNYDFGTELNLAFLKTKTWAFFQISLCYFEYKEWPYLQMNFGMGRLFGFMFSCYKFGLSFDLFGHIWHHFNDNDVTKSL